MESSKAISLEELISKASFSSVISSMSSPLTFFLQC